MELKLEVYTPGLQLIGVLEVFQSVLWEEYAFKAGSFSVESLLTAEAVSLLVPENILWIEGETAGLIEVIQESAGADGPRITAKGPLLTGVLERRVLWGRYNLHGPVPALLYQMVDDCAIHPTRGDAEERKLPGLVLAGASPDGPTIRKQKTGGSLLEFLEEVGETNQTAFGVRLNPQVPRMEFWARPGVDRSVHQSALAPVLYSTELDDVLASEYAYDASEWKNVALVAGEGEGADRTYVTVNGDGGEPPTPPPGPDTYIITVATDPVGGGTITGGGAFEENASVTVTATAGSGYTFAGWRENGEIISTAPALTFAATADRTITAVFAAVPTYTIAVSIDPVEAGTVTGPGRYQAGATVTLTATRSEGYTFTGWQEGGATVSTDTTYTFPASEDRTLTAAFAVAVKKLAYHGTAETLSTSRSGLAAATTRNHALFAGGYTGSSYVSTVNAYDAALTRSTPTALSSGRQNLAGAEVGGYALFGGGQSSASAYSGVVNTYDASLTRTSATALSAVRASLAAATVGNYALFGGGTSGTPSSPSRSKVVDAYNVSLTRSTPTALSKSRDYLAAVSIGNFAVFGGGKSSSPLSTVDAYNASLTLSTPTALSVARYSLVATSTGKHALFGGGMSSTSGTRSAVVDAYNVSLTRSTPTALSVARSGPGVTAIGEYAVFAGGQTGTSTTEAVVDAYNATLTRSLPTKLSAARSIVSAATIEEYAVFAGGYTGSVRSNVVDVYTLQ